VVRLRIVERVRTDARPVPFRILAHVDEAGTAGQADEARVESDAAALVLVDLGQMRIADGGKEATAEARRATRGRLGRAAHEDHGWTHGLWRDANCPPAPFERLARPRLAEHVDVLLGEPPAGLPVDARHRELLGTVAETRDQAH